MRKFFSIICFSFCLVLTSFSFSFADEPSVRAWPDGNSNKYYIKYDKYNSVYTFTTYDGDRTISGNIISYTINSDGSYSNPYYYSNPITLSEPSNVSSTNNATLYEKFKNSYNSNISFIGDPDGENSNNGDVGDNGGGSILPPLTEVEELGTMITQTVSLIASVGISVLCLMLSPRLVKKLYLFLH